MTEADRYQGLLTVSVLLDGILKDEYEKRRCLILSGDETQREKHKKRIAKLELSRQALDESRHMVPVEIKEAE